MSSGTSNNDPSRRRRPPNKGHSLGPFPFERKANSQQSSQQGRKAPLYKTNLSALGVKERLGKLEFEMFEESRSQASNLVVLSEG